MMRLSSYLRKLGDRKIALFLGLINILIHFRWFFNLNIFTSGDWQFISDARYNDFFHMSPIWIAEGMGTTSAVPAFYFVRFLEGFLSFFGSSFALNEKLLFFLPIVLCSSIGAYFFLRQYLRPTGAILGTLIFCFNTATLFNYAGVLTIATAYALSPVALYLFQKSLEHPKQKYRFVIAALVFALMIAYEQRIFLIIGAVSAGILIHMLIIHRQTLAAYVRERIPGLAIFGGLIVLLHSFWLVPYALNAGSGVSFSNLLDRELFESFSTIQNSLTLQHPFWTGARPATFLIQDIMWYVWLIPLVAFAALFLPRQARNKSYHSYIFWAIIAGIGIFLVKQANGPFPGVYPWLYEQLPGAAAFREASKFYILVILAYAIMIPYSLAAAARWIRTFSAKRQRFSTYAYRFVVVAVIAVFAINISPLLTGSFRTLLTPRTMPADYKTFNAFIDKQPEYFRVMWAPAVPRWAATSNTHPALAAGTFESGEWLSQLGRNPADSFPTQRDKATGLFQESSAVEALQSAAVKYVAIPVRDLANEDDMYRNYGDSRAYFLEKLANTPYLKKVDLPLQELVVYENTSFAPYATAVSNVQSIASDSTLPVSRYRSFVQTALQTQFNPIFTKGLSKDIAPATTAITAPFDHPETAKIENGHIKKQLDNTGGTVLFVDTTARHLTYRLDEGRLTFYSSTQQNLHVNDNPTVDSKTSEIGSIPLKDGVSYYLSKDSGKVSVLSVDNPQGYLGSVDKTLAVYEAAGTPAYQQSFEKDMWEKKVSDCNPYDKKAEIDMFASDWSASNSKTALGLGANRHTACTTSPGQPTNNAQNLLVSFNYRVLGGQSVEAQVIYNDPSKTVVKEHFDTRRSGWRQHQFTAEVPKDATSYQIRLLGHPDYLHRGRAVTLYDNLQVRLSTPVMQFNAGEPTYQRFDLTEDTATLSYRLSDNQGKELVKNGDFKEGPWPQKAWNCNEYDESPSIGSAWRTEKDSNRYLELRAKRHASCMSHDTIGVQPFATYLLSFSHRSPNNSAAAYRITFNDPDQTIIEERIPSKKDWNVFSKQIVAPPQATEARITLITYEGSQKTKQMVNHYDAVGFKEIPAISSSYTLVKKPTLQLAKPQRVTFENINPTTKYVQVQKARQPFFLAQSEQYNPLWKVRPLERKETLGDYLDYFPRSSAAYLAPALHARIFGHTNGWLIDPGKICNETPGACKQHKDGSYDMSLAVEYVPQRWYNVGLILSTITLVGCLSYLFLRWYNLHHKKKLGHFIFH